MALGGARIQLCGELVVELGGRRRENALRGRQGRLGFAYLLLHRHRPIRRDELVAALWPEDRAPPREQALAPVLSRIRSAIAPAVLEGRDSVQLRLPEPAWIDVEVALAELVAARHASEQHDAPKALRSARTATDLLGGGLLPAHEADWLDAERERVADLRVEALELAARAAIRVGGAALPQAELDARRAVSEAPFRESARAALISVLAARGNSAEALRAYEDIRELLMEELGTVPGSELMTLHTSLLTGAPPTGSTGETPALGNTSPSALPDAPTQSPADLPAPGALTLVERHDELRRIASTLQAVAGRHGGVVTVEGPAGIGKTRLLREIRARAAATSFQTFDARAGVLEREFGFGVVRQLFAGVAGDPELTSGPAVTVRGVLADSGSFEGTFPVLNGLHHLVLNLAARGPLLMSVDDLHWADPASLRFLVYLARRLTELPVLVVATIRTGEPDTDELLLAELTSDPETVVLRPRPLTEAATGSLVRERLGTPDVEFVSACQAVTAGNPLLIRQLLGALEDNGVDPDADRVSEVNAIGPRAVSRTVLSRLARLPQSTVAVARAAAILGEDPGLPELAAVASADEAETAAAVAHLARADILRAEGSLGFVHPLVRDAVYSELPTAARGLEHGRAARVLSELGASPERVAAQLLLTPPRADPWVVTQLRDAAEVAMRRGAPDAALRLLARAQAEPPSRDQRAALALELGGSAAYIRGPAGVEPLEQAYAGLEDPVTRARAAIRLSHLLLFVRSPSAGITVAKRAMAELPDGHDDLLDGLRAIRLIGVQFGAPDPEASATLDAVRRGPRGTGPGARALTAMTALAVALGDGTSAEASALAHEAFAGEGMAGFEVTAPVALATAVLTLGEPGEGLRAINAYRIHARRQGEILGSIGAELWGGFAQLLAGDLREAIESLDRAHEGEQLWGTKLDAVMAYSSAFLTQAWVERGDPVRARQMSDRMDDVSGASDGARFWMVCRSALLIAEGDPEAALDLSARVAPLYAPGTNPIWAPWRSVQARALAALGRIEQANAIALEELALAERVAAPWAIGRIHRLLAQIGGPDALEHARQAVSLLSTSSARLESAKAHAALGEHLAARDDRAGAVEALHRALDGARQCGADALAARADAALSSLG